MSAKHPVIAVTGSSGAGTTTTSLAFRKIFAQLNLHAAEVEGDSFHPLHPPGNGHGDPQSARRRAAYQLLRPRG
ncbi:putative phosphoribulokinase [Escherichia coli]|uniref:Putative phosphoribulokinase n=1 Tax=Escherichia coli TaxID=562 RepID=A0A377BXJ0_ECOLX|nr:putative phosphoribulokinase [Escherichia coli]